jgi:hypothetical protein
VVFERSSLLFAGFFLRLHFSATQSASHAAQSATDRGACARFPGCRADDRAGRRAEARAS